MHPISSLCAMASMELEIARALHCLKSRHVVLCGDEMSWRRTTDGREQGVSASLASCDRINNSCVLSMRRGPCTRAGCNVLLRLAGSALSFGPSSRSKPVSAMDMWCAILRRQKGFHRGGRGVAGRVTQGAPARLSRKLAYLLEHYSISFIVPKAHSIFLPKGR